MSSHAPVMLDEVLEALDIKDGGVYVDGTFGAGGYSRAILEAANCHVYAIDRDPSALKRAEEVEQDYKGRFTFMRGCFGDVATLLKEAGHEGKVNGFVLDIGVSSMQIDEASRGFSFRFDGPLDMRMDSESDDGLTAADMVNTYPEKELADLIYQYGEERRSRHIAKAIVLRRKEIPFSRTKELAECIRSVMPKRPKDKIDQATRTFQALRIAVNDELGELSRALDVSECILEEEGRLVVVSFHSLEDGLVKRFLKEKSGANNSVSRHVPQTQEKETPVYMRPKRNKAIKSSTEEIARNPRSRSARLRYAVRLSALDEGGAEHK